MQILQSPLNYTGSKANLIEQLQEHFPEHIKGQFIDVFTGGGSVVLNTSYERYVANDIIPWLIDFYKLIQIMDWDDLLNKINQYKISKDSPEEYANLRNLFNNNQNHDEASLMFFSLVSSCTNNLMRFNNSFKFNQTFGKRSINDNTIKRLKAYFDLIKTKNIQFENKTFELLIEENINPDNFFYLDPPYTSTKEFKIEAGYNCYWSKQHEDNLWNCLKVLNDNNCKFAVSNILEKNGVKNPSYDKFKKWNLIELNYDYEKVARNKNSNIIEIVIKNY